MRVPTTTRPIFLDPTTDRALTQADLDHMDETEQTR